MFSIIIIISVAVLLYSYRYDPPEITEREYKQLQEYLYNPTISPVIEDAMLDNKITVTEYKKIGQYIVKLNDMEKLNRTIDIKKTITDHYKKLKEEHNERKSS